MDIRELVGKDFKFKKSLGQNFISDGNLLKAIVADAEVTEADTVVEIGAGAGTLTEILAKKAGRVISFEVDRDLSERLEALEKTYSNLTVNFADVLKLSDEQMRVWVPEQFKVVANLPYYVTTPMIMRFVDGGLDVTEMTVMVQKEVADRLTAKANTPEYGAITVAIEAVADVSVTRIIDRRMFYPSPGVDSALIKIKFNKNKYEFIDYKIFKRTVKAAFAMRRKTLANNLISAFPITKAEAEKIIEESGYPSTVRGEVLPCADLVKLANKLSK